MLVGLSFAQPAARCGLLARLSSSHVLNVWLWVESSKLPVGQTPIRKIPIGDRVTKDGSFPNVQRKIALVEDSADSAELFTKFLGQFCDDLQVRCFRNGLEFLKTFQPGIYRVAVLDLAMPEMDGYEVLRRIRSLDPGIAAIAFTAHATSNTRQKAIEAGFNAFVTKPVEDMDAFCQKIVDFVNHMDAS